MQARIRGKVGGDATRCWIGREEGCLWREEGVRLGGGREGYPAAEGAGPSPEPSLCFVLPGLRCPHEAGVVEGVLAGDQLHHSLANGAAILEFADASASLPLLREDKQSGSPAHGHEG